MNIAIVFDALVDHAIGSLVSTLRFSERLKKRGHKIIFLAAKYPGTQPIGYFKGYRVYRFRSSMLPRSEKKFFISFPTAKEIRDILINEKIAILHVMMPTPAAIVSVKAAKQLGIKIVIHSHTQPENLFLNIPKMLYANLINHLFYKYMISLYSKADIIICPSKFAERKLKRYDPNLKTIVISNGVDTSEFKKINSDFFLKKHSIQKKHKNILFVGRLHPEKNVKVLIKAMPLLIKKTKDVRLTIAGSGYLQKSLKKLARTLNVGRYILFLGRLGHKDLLGAYNSCDVFVLPSLVELEGMVVLEAMACGKPILISNSKESASVDFVKENGFLFEKKDPKDLSVKLWRILKNEKLRIKMGRISFKNSRDYDINKSVDMLERVYASL